MHRTAIGRLFSLLLGCIAAVAGSALPLAAQAAITTVSVPGAANMMIAAPLAGCPLMVPGPYNYGTLSFTSAAASSYAFNVTGFDLPAPPATLLLYPDGTFDSSNPSTGLIACSDVPGSGVPPGDPLAPRLVATLAASTVYTVVVMKPQVAFPGPEPDVVATLGLGIEPSLSSFPNATVAYPTAWTPVPASNSPALIAFVVQNPFVAALTGPGQITPAGPGATFVAAVQAAEPGAWNPLAPTFGAGSLVRTLTVTSPALTAATYDAASGVLVVTGTGMNAGDSIDPSKLTLTGEGAATYVLTSPGVTASSATSFTINLNSTDKAAVNLLLNKNGTSSTGGTAYNIAAANLWDTTTPGAPDATGNGVSVSNVGGASCATAYSQAGFTILGCGANTLSGTPCSAACAVGFAGTIGGAVSCVSGAYSGSFTGCLPANPPGAPTIGTATAGDARATVTFTAPASDGGSAVTGYAAESSPAGGSGNCAGACTSIVVTGLTNGTAYTFTVRAINGVGTGAASAASNSVTPKGPQTITFANPGPQNFGTSPTLAATTTAAGLTVAFSTTTRDVCTVTSAGVLTFVTRGTCSIDADQAGNGAFLAAARVTQAFQVRAVVPGAPTQVVASPGIRRAVIQFNPPASNGGAPITGYSVICTPSDGGPAATALAATSPITVDNLTNGVAYSCSVRASNSAGAGPASVPVVVVPATVPGAPTDVSASPGDGRVTVEFAPPASNGGASITAYTATCGAVPASGPSSPIVVTGLSNSTPYTCTVRASNSAGEGPASAASNSVVPFVNYCAASPCLNGGTCSNGSATFTCACTTGWRGPNCATRVSSASRLVFTAAPSTATGQAEFAIRPVVMAQDDGGILAPFAGSVTLSISSGATLACASNTAVAAAGVATFEGCKIDRGGTFTLTAAATGLASATTTVTVAPPPMVTLSVSKLGEGVVSGGGLDCGSTCSIRVAGGSTANLTATPATGHYLVAWLGACRGTATLTCTLVLQGDTVIQPVFATTGTSGTAALATLGIVSAGLRVFDAAAFTLASDLISGEGSDEERASADDEIEENKKKAKKAVEKGGSAKATIRSGITSVSQFLRDRQIRGKAATDAVFIRALYRALLGREPDSGGAGYWESLLAGGMSRDVVLAGFLRSDEFNRYMAQVLPEPPARPEVDWVVELYRSAFERMPDDGGLDHFVDLLRSAQCRGGSAIEAGSVAAAFFLSAEYEGTGKTHGAFIDDLYDALLERMPDPVGRAYWVSRLEGGLSRSAVLSSFLRAPEFQPLAPHRVATGSCLS